MVKCDKWEELRAFLVSNSFHKQSDSDDSLCRNMVQAIPYADEAALIICQLTAGTTCRYKFAYPVKAMIVESRLYIHSDTQRVFCFPFKGGEV